MLDFSANKKKKSLARDTKDQNNIVKLAFHGRIFIGNLCHWYLNQKTTNKDSNRHSGSKHVTRISHHQSNPELKYNKVNYSFRDVHVAV